MPENVGNPDDPNHLELVGIAKKLLRVDVSFDDSQRLYRDWVAQGTYDKMLENSKDYVALRVLREAADKFFTDKDNQMILDIGAGTGLSGKMLKEIGVKNIHALEPLKEFAVEAEKKGIYSKIYNEKIGFATQISAERDTYDGIIACGAYGPGHIPTDALYEMMRIVKPGGYIINCMRFEYLTTVEEYRDRFEPLVDRLASQGKLGKVVWRNYPKHFLDKEGILMVLQVV